MKQLFSLLFLLIAINAIAGNEHKSTTSKKPVAKAKQEHSAIQPLQQAQNNDRDEYGTRMYDARLARMLHADSAGNLPANYPMRTVIGSDGKETLIPDVMDERLIRSRYVSPEMSKPSTMGQATTN